MGIEPGRINRAAIRALLIDAKTVELVNAEAEQLAEACNSQSSWGGYDHADASTAGRARARVWSYGRHDGTDTARALRLIANLGKK